MQSRNLYKNVAQVDWLNNFYIDGFSCKFFLVHVSCTEQNTALFMLVTQSRNCSNMTAKYVIQKMKCTAMRNVLCGRSLWSDF